MRRTARLRVVAAAAALGMLTAACGGSDSGDGGDSNVSGESTGEAGGDLRIYSSEPAFLVPTAANDEPAILVLRQLYRGLVKYNPESGEPELDLAESIETEDNKVWTITVKDGYEFSNGEPVDADAFLRAWNYAGNINNAQNNAYFFNRVEGFEEMQSKGAPKEAEFSGLKKIDDRTIEVTLNQPFVGFEAILGYSGFFPVAQECLDDFDACNEQPIGNGPYMMDGPWERNVQIKLTRNENYGGEDTGKADNLIYRIFDSVDTAYAAFQGGELDIMYTVPPNKIPEVKQQYADSSLIQSGDSFTYLGMPLYDKRFEDPNLHKAFSLAIDRQAIVDAIYDGAYTPADGWVAPSFDGYREGVCDTCEYDPEQAKELFDEAGGFDGKLQLWANGGAGHEEWLQAVGDGFKRDLGVDYQLKVDITDFGEYLELADNFQFTGPFRLGWGPDYPVMETYLQPLYGSDASSNSSGYDNPQFDQLIQEGDQAATLDEAITKYQEAEDLLAEDMPVVPLWWGTEVVVWNPDTVNEIVFNTISDVEYGQVTLNQ